MNVLIVSNDEPIFENQRRLTKLILTDDKLRNKLLVYLHAKTEDKIMITFKNEMDYEYMSIENLRNYSLKRDGLKTYNYVVSIIQFLGNLCRGNNF